MRAGNRGGQSGQWRAPLQSIPGFAFRVEHLAQERIRDENRELGVEQGMGAHAKARVGACKSVCMGMQSHV